MHKKIYKQKKSKNRDIGLYIHIPFCKTICAYCTFPTFANKNNKISKYIDALKQEIKSKSPLFKNKKLKTIYFGGGTPSLLEINELKSILTSIKTHFDHSELESIEIETNPESITKEKIEAYKKLEITRISIGIQTFHDNSLKKIARHHDSITAINALEILQKSKFKNFNCDFIIGLPYQNLELFKKDLKTILKFNPSHISTYFLMHESDKMNFFIKEIPDEKEQIKMYKWAEKKLVQKGFEHYEISNFAKPGYASKHNLRYWNVQDYLGIGLGAHSFYHGTIWENENNFNKYLISPTKHIYKQRLTGEMRLYDYIMMKFRLSKGINIKELIKKFDSKKINKTIKKFKQLNSKGYLQINRKQIIPTLKGKLQMDSVLKEIFE